MKPLSASGHRGTRFEKTNSGRNNLYRCEYFTALVEKRKKERKKERKKKWISITHSKTVSVCFIDLKKGSAILCFD